MIKFSHLLRVFSLALISFLIGARVLLAQEILEFDGLAREYLLYVPEDLQTPAPLVIALHGGGGTAQQFRDETDFDIVARNNGFIVVYPQGYNREWNEERGSGMTVRRTDADDVGFIDALIDHLARQYVIDLNRVYVMGHSNGGFMSLRLACDISERFAGVGVVSAELTEDMAADCHPLKPLRIAIINGTEDPIIPYDGGEVRVSGLYRGDVAGTAFTIDSWLGWNDCDAAIKHTLMIDTHSLDETAVELTDWWDCAPDGGVRLLRVEGGGHGMPGGLTQAIFGSNSREIEVPEELWAFWSGG